MLYFHSIAVENRIRISKIIAYLLKAKFKVAFLHRATCFQLKPEKAVVGRYLVIMAGQGAVTRLRPAEEAW